MAAIKHPLCLECKVTHTFVETLSNQSGVKQKNYVYMHARVSINLRHVRVSVVLYPKMTKQFAKADCARDSNVITFISKQSAHARAQGHTYKQEHVYV